MNMCKRPPTVEWTDCCYGVDETPTGPILVKAVRRGRQAVIEPVASLPPAGTAARACGLTEKEAWTRRVTAPLDSADKVCKVLPALLDVQLPFGIEECVFDCVSMERNPDRSGWTVMAAVTRQADALARLAEWGKADREPHVLDQEGLALWTQTGLECPPADAMEARAVVYLGEARAVLAFGRGNRLAVTHGLRQFDPEPARRLARMALEERDESIRWFWTGPLAERREALEDIRSRMSRTAPLQDRALNEPAAILARAYAVRALTAGPLRCDLRTGSLAHPHVALLRRRRAVLNAAVGLGAGLIVLTAGLVWNGLLKNRETLARRAVAVRAREVVAQLGGGYAVNPGYEVRSVSNALAVAEAAYAPFVRMRGPSRVRRLGRLFMAAREHNAVLHRLEWSDAVFRIEGRLEHAAACEAFARRVEAETGLKPACRTDRKDAHGVRFVMETGSGL